MSVDTRPSLLGRVRDAEDHAAWSQFVEIYAPLVHAYGRRHGMQDADAADLVQEVLCAAARNLGTFEYDALKGSFRGWLFTITRNKFLNWATRKQDEPNGSGDSGMVRLLHEHPAEDEKLWERQHQWHLVRWAAKRVRHEFQPKTWAAFEKTALAQESASQVASELGISKGAVYIAKSRVLARIREIVQELEGRY